PESGRDAPPRPLPQGAGLEEPREQGRAPPQRIGEELARAAEPGDEVQRTWVAGEEPEERGSVALGGQALEIVERHVGIGRLRHLVEEAREERDKQLGIP